MKQVNISKKSKSAKDVVEQTKASAKGGPVELSQDDLKKVSGGLPRGTWAVNTATRKKSI